MEKGLANKFISEVVKLLYWILIVSLPVIGYEIFSNIGLVIGIAISIGLVFHLIIRFRAESDS